MSELSKDRFGHAPSTNEPDAAGCCPKCGAIPCEIFNTIDNEFFECGTRVDDKGVDGYTCLQNQLAAAKVRVAELELYIDTLTKALKKSMAAGYKHIKECREPERKAEIAERALRNQLQGVRKKPIA